MNNYFHSRGTRVARISSDLTEDACSASSVLLVEWMSSPQAFVLGAGLGTRLRPLTNSWPKPLIPFLHRPLITYPFDHLKAELQVERICVNTHHCPHRYKEVFPENRYQGMDLTFTNEPTLLDTAGGLDNIRDWLQDESFVVYNGDILTDIPLAAAWAEHQEKGNLVTMLLRSQGDELRVGFDPEAGRIRDLRGLLEPDETRRFQFTGVYFVHPRFFDYIEPGRIESVVLPIVRAIQAGERVGGVLCDEGFWSDLGSQEAYLDALADLPSDFPRYAEVAGAEQRLEDARQVPSDCRIDAISTVSRTAKVGAAARIERSAILAGGEVAEGEFVRGEIRLGGGI